MHVCMYIFMCTCISTCGKHRLMSCFLPLFSTLYFETESLSLNLELPKLVSKPQGLPASAFSTGFTGVYSYTQLLMWALGS